MKRCMCMLMLLTMVMGMSLSASASPLDSGAASAVKKYPAAVSLSDNSLKERSSDTYGSYGSFFDSKWFQDWFDKLPGNGDNGDSGDNEDNGETENFPAPEQVTVTGKTGIATREMRVKWEAVENAVKYVTQLCENPDFTGEVRENIVKGTTIVYAIRSGVGVYYYPAHETYYIRVKAIFNNGESEWSKTVVSEGDR